MADYDFVCKDCEIVWEEEWAMKDAPSKSPCPRCEKVCERWWEGMVGSQGLHFKGTGWHSTKHRFFGHDKEVRIYDRSSNQDIDEFYEGAIKGSKDRIESGDSAKQYSRMDINVDYWAEKGVAKRKTVEEQGQQAEKAKDFVNKHRENLDRDKL